MVLGGMIFGAGWAITGACPGPIYAQIGGGAWIALFTLAGAVGPVAMVSLLVLTGVGELAAPGSPEFIGMCLTLALMVGVLQITMALFRLGFLSGRVCDLFAKLANVCSVRARERKSYLAF